MYMFNSSCLVAEVNDVACGAYETDRVNHTCRYSRVCLGMSWQLSMTILFSSTSRHGTL